MDQLRYGSAHVLNQRLLQSISVHQDHISIFAILLRFYVELHPTRTNDHLTSPPTEVLV